MGLPWGLQPLCLLTLLCCVIAVMSVLALLVDIWAITDLVSSHQFLWDLVQNSVPDRRLEYGLYLLLCLGLLGPVLLLCDRFSRDKQNEATMCSSSVQVISIVTAVVLCAGHLTAAILAGSYQNEAVPQIGPTLHDKLANHTYMMREPFARWVFIGPGEYFNYMQTKFSCCGIDSYEDYNTHRFAERHEKEPFPYSCCRLRSSAQWHDPDISDVKDLFLCQNKNPNAFHNKPCLPLLKEWLHAKANFLLGFSLTLFLFVIMWLGLTGYIIYSISGKPF